MQTIEFETTAQGHTIHVPDTVPDGVRLEVRVIIGRKTTAPPEGDLKTLLASLTEGLSDEDLARPREFGREPPKWDT